MENEVKEPAPKYNFISPEEYLAMERASDEKHEYYDGYVVAMSGASITHNYIGHNLSAELGPFLKNKDCNMFSSDMRVSTPGRDAYVYPDAVIICGQPELEDDKFDTLLNPTVVIEILSPSTKRNDAGYKLLYYKNIPSIQQCIMIDSKTRHVRSETKQTDGAWRFEDITDRDSKLNIPILAFSISLDDIYRDTGL